MSVLSLLASTLLALFALSGCGTSTVQREQAHASLVAAERAFAADGLRDGIHDAFLRHFAPGGLLFVPKPTRVNDVFRERPADPHAVLLEWAPVASGVSTSGDFGFTTGPARLSLRDGSKPPRHNTFFSIWKRTGDGPWRVVLDAGTSVPEPVPPARMLPSPAVPPALAADAAIEPLLAAERAQPWTREDFLARLAADAQLQRSGALPVQGPAAIAHAWHAASERLAPLGGEMAGGGDLAYTYGEARTADGSGHYVHLWTRAPDGRAWRIAVALRLP
jgi:ketosteroid isomerase-like protein